MTSSPSVVVLDYGSGNVRSAVRALERVGADVELTADRAAAEAADGLLVPGVGNFHACMAALRTAGGPRIVDHRLAGGRPVLGICVGMQVMFEGSDEPGTAPEDGLGEWPGRVTRLDAGVVPHTGWSEVETADGSRLFEGVAGERFYFVHSYAVPRWEMSVPAGSTSRTTHLVTTATHGRPFVAAVENGPLSATQFHPEKSGDAGLHLLENWVRSL